MIVSSILFLSEYAQSYAEILGYLSGTCVVLGRGIGLEVYLDAFGAVLLAYAIRGGGNHENVSSDFASTEF